MSNMRYAGLRIIYLCLVIVAGANAQDTAAPKSAPVLGTIKAISGSLLTITPDIGPELKFTIADGARLVRVPPGAKDLKEAVVITVSDLQVGDRVLIRIKQGSDVANPMASSVILMKKSDISDLQSKEKEDWQRRGIGGLVTAVDASTGVITVGTTTAAGKKDVAIHTDAKTIFRRYSPDSVKFEAARAGNLADVKAGDQLRARGNRSSDGNDFAAEEVVSGAFRNISGTIAAIDSAANTMTVNDLVLKKPVEIRITGESQLRKLPLPMAQRIAARLKGQSPDASAPGATGAASAPPAAAQGAANRPAGAPPSGAPPAAGQAGPGGQAGLGGAAGASGQARQGGDLQQMLSRLPASTLADFQKGDAVLIVTTEGKKDGGATAITLLGGVEPILEASPKGQASILTPWSLNAGGGDAGN